jgi:hypothetical protein
MTLVTRKPTGKPSWPIILLAGAEKSGKTYHAAHRLILDLIGRTLWVTVSGKTTRTSTARSTVPGSRSSNTTGRSAGSLPPSPAALSRPSGVPNLIVLDSATRLWDLLCDEAQASANRRAATKAAKYKPVPDEDVTISMDLWNAAKQRWAHVIDALRDHDGPSLVTARLDQVTIVNDNGDPTKDKTSKVKAEKSLPYDVGAIVEMPAVGEAWLRGVRSLRFKPGDTGKAEFKDFTVDALWRRLGLAEDVGTRTHSSVSVEAPTPHRGLVNEIALLADAAGIDRAQVAADWAEAHDGQPITQATDVGGLELLRDELKAKGKAA